MIKIIPYTDEIYTLHRRSQWSTLSREFQRVWPKFNPTFFWDFGKSNIWTDRRVITGLTRVAFLRENRRFSRDSPTATQSEGKKHCASSAVSLGTCSPPPRQQLINRSALSPETRETHRAASLSLWMAFRTDYFSFTVVKSRQTVLNMVFLTTRPRLPPFSPIAFLRCDFWKDTNLLYSYVTYRFF